MAHQQTEVIEACIRSIVVIVGSPTLPFERANAVAAYAARNPGWSGAQEVAICRSPATLAVDLDLYPKLLKIVFEQQRHLLTSPGAVFVQYVSGQVRGVSQATVPIGLVTACRAAVDDVEVRVVDGPLSFVARQGHVLAG